MNSEIIGKGIATNAASGAGGSTILGYGGPLSWSSNNGSNGIGYGAGGSGGGSCAAANSGAGGGGGGCLQKLIVSPNASYGYLVGAAGSAGATGTGCTPGGAGTIGFIDVVEHY